MGPDGCGMEAPDRHSEAGTRRLREQLSAIQLIGVEIDVCVEIANAVLGHDRHLAERR